MTIMRLRRRGFGADYSYEDDDDEQTNVVEVQK